MYTEEDLKKSRGTTEGGLVKGLASPSPSPSADPDAAFTPEKAWRSRAEVVRAAIASAEQDLKAAETELASLGAIPPPSQAASGRDPMVEHQQRVTAARTRVDEARKAVDGAREALAELEDEARRKQIPPGWLRER